MTMEDGYMDIYVLETIVREYDCVSLKQPCMTMEIKAIN